MALPFTETFGGSENPLADHWTTMPSDGTFFLGSGIKEVSGAGVPASSGEYVGSYIDDESPDPDQYLKFTLKTNSSSYGLCGAILRRDSTSGDCYVAIVRCTTSNARVYVQIYDFSADTLTSIGPASYELIAGGVADESVLEFRIAGQNPGVVTVLDDTVQLGDDVWDDSELDGGGNFGICAYWENSTDPIFDDLEAGNLGSAAIEVTPGSVSLELATYDAGINAETNVLASVTSHELAKYAATVKLNVNVSVDSSALAITQNAANVNAETNVQASSLSFEITALPASIKADTSITASLASFEITANQAGVNAETNVLCSSTDFEIQAYPVNVSTGSGISVDATSVALVLTVNPAQIGLGLNIQASTGTYELTTNGATLKIDRNVLASYAELEITSHAARVFSRELITAIKMSLLAETEAEAQFTESTQASAAMYQDTQARITLQ